MRYFYASYRTADQAFSALEDMFASGEVYRSELFYDSGFVYERKRNRPYVLYLKG